MAVLSDPGTAAKAVGVLAGALLTTWRGILALVVEIETTDRVPPFVDGVLPLMRNGTAALEDEVIVAELGAKVEVVVAGAPPITNGTAVLVGNCEMNRDDDAMVVASASPAVSNGTAVLIVELDNGTEGDTLEVTESSPITKGIAVLVAILRRGLLACRLGRVS
jgi:hypothetical protein